MKRTMTIIVTCLMMAMVATAQGVKISPKLEKGMKKTYQVETVMSVAGKEIKLTAKQTYEVKNKLADGYQLDFTVSDFSSSLAEDDVMGLLMVLGQQLENGQTTSMKVDADGKVVGLLNYGELKQKLLETAEAILNRLIEKFPNVAQMVPADALKNQLMAQLTEEAIVNTTREAVSVLTLNGRQIMTGAQENYTNAQGLKMQRMYFLTQKDGSALSTSSKMNMTNDELKQMVIAQVEKTMPDQAEMIKQNIDMMMSQLNFDATEKATYEMDADGWVNTLHVETTQDAMGQKTSQTTTVRLVK